MRKDHANAKLRKGGSPRGVSVYASVLLSCGLIRVTFLIHPKRRARVTISRFPLGKFRSSICSVN